MFFFTARERKVLIFVGVFIIAAALFRYFNLTGYHEPEQVETIIKAKININTAVKSDLELIPGVGPVTAQSIIEYRNKHGIFSKPNDLLNIKGIGPKKLEKIKTSIEF